MKKVAYFFASFLPVIITLSAQFLAVFFMMGMAALFLFPVIPGLFGHSASISDFTSLMTNTDFNSVVMLVYSILNICIFGMWYYHSCGGEFLPKPAATFHPMQFAGVIVLVPGAQFACSYLIGLLSMLFPSWLEQYERLLENAGLNESISAIMLCYSVILAPIAEELVFRGVTMRLARQALPFWLANLLQALLFGVFHMNLLQGCYAFVLGVLLGFICEKGGSIYYSILLHLLFNLWGTVISQLLNNVENSTVFAGIMLITMVISLAAGLALFFTGIQRKKARILQMNQPSGNSDQLV